MGNLETKLRPPLEELLEPGEELQAACVATQSSMLKGRMVGIGVTEGRLLVQGLTRRFEPDGPATALTPEQVAKVSAEGAGGGWAEIGAAIMDHAAVTLKLRTTDGEKLKLTMMRGEGPLGRLGGGEAQRHGVQALGAWFASHASTRRGVVVAAAVRPIPVRYSSARLRQSVFRASRGGSDLRSSSRVRCRTQGARYAHVADTAASPAASE